MAYNHGKAERRWRLWKEKEEKILRECGVDEETIEEIRTFDREEFNSDRRFYTRLNDVGEYIAETAMQEPLMEVNTVWDMLNEIEDENLYRALLTVDKRICPLCGEVRANQKMLDKYHFEQCNRVNAGTAIALILVQQLHQFV